MENKMCAGRVKIDLSILSLTLQLSLSNKAKYDIQSFASRDSYVIIMICY